MANIRNLYGVMDVMPNPKTNSKEKAANDYKLIKETIKYYLSLADFPDYSNLRRIANNILNESDYDDINKVYKRQKLKKYRGSIANIPLVEPIIRLLVGEKRKFPFKYTVEVTNPDIESNYLESLSEVITTTMQKEFVNQMSGNTEKDEQEQIPTVIRNFKTSWQDDRAEAGHETLTQLIKDKEVKQLVHKIYKNDWLNVGEAYAKVSLVKDDVSVQILRPEDVWIEYSELSDKAEDGQAAVVRIRYSLSDLLVKFGDELSKVKIKGKTLLDLILDAINLRTKFPSSGTKKFNIKSDVYLQEVENYGKLGSSYRKMIEDDYIELYYVVFKSFDSYKELTYLDEFGMEQLKEVSNDYIVNKEIGDIKTETIWYNKVYSGYIFPGGNITNDSGTINPNDIFLSVGELDIQTTDINNNNICKLNIVGRKDGVSIPKQLEEFQKLYNIVHHIEKNTLAKDKGNPLLFPINLVPNLEDWGKDDAERLETMLWYSDVFNVMFFDGSSDRVASLAQAMKSVNMSTLELVGKFIELKNNIKQDAWDAIGMNRNRWGASLASEGKGKNEQDIIRSSMHTADMNLTFNQFEEQLLNMMMDVSKVAYINGKTIIKDNDKSDYSISDRTKLIFKLDGEKHACTNYGVRVVPVEEIRDKLESLRTLVQPYAQNIGNGIPPDLVGNIAINDNPSKIIKYLKEADQLQKEFTAQREKSAAEQQKALVEMQEKGKEDARNFEKLLIDSKLKLDKYKTDLQEETKRMMIGNDNITPDQSYTGENISGSDKLNLENRKLDIAEDRNKIQRESNIQNYILKEKSEKNKSNLNKK